MAAVAPAVRCCLTKTAVDYLRGQGVATSLVDLRLRQGTSLTGAAPQPVHLDQVQAVHSFLLQQQRLRRITSAALVLESTPEALCLDVQQHLRPLLACLKELGFSQEHTTAVFRALRKQRAQAQQFLALGPAELQRRFFWLATNLGLGLEESSHAAAAYLATQPTLLLVEPAEAAAVVRWLSTTIGWRQLALRRHLARHPGILLRPAVQLEEAAVQLLCHLDASLDEVCLLLTLAPGLLALTQQQLVEALAAHPTSWQLAASYMDRRPIMMAKEAEALHLQVATLFVMQRYNMSRHEVACLVRDKPTVLRNMRLY